MSHFLLPKSEYEAVKSKFQPVNITDPDGADQYSKGFDEGFKYALEIFSFWRNDVRVIGLFETPIQVILEGIKSESL